MTSKPTTPEPGVSEPSPDRTSPDRPEESLPEKSIREDEDQIETQHSDSHDTVQSPPAAGSADEPAQAPPIAKSDEADTSDDGSTATSADATEESAAGSSSAPPLPSEPLPTEQDDGWDCHWDQANQSWFFHNRITNQSTWENPRVPSQPAVPAQPAASTGVNTQLQTPPATAVPPLNEPLPAGGYNPAIHGDYDPNAWYAQNGKEGDEPEVPVMDSATAYAAIGSFNRFTGRWQGDDQDPERHNDEAKSRRQMNAFFDVDAAANAHDGRSLKAERSGKKPSKSELKQFKEKRRARKEEKRRAWLRD